MKNTVMAMLLTLLTVMAGTGKLRSQTNQPSKVEFLNAPVLFKENGRSFQQVFARLRSEKGGSITFTISGKVLLNAEVAAGNNRYLLTIPAVTKPQKITIGVKLDSGGPEKYQVNLVPPKKWEIYFVQHSHTDIGYTKPQSEILAEHMRYIDYALDYCDQTDSYPDDARFRWTCESAWVTKEYVLSRPAAQVERLKKRIAEGRIEVTGMFANMAEIVDEDIMYDFLQPLRELGKNGITAKVAMQNDVNGVAWCMPDYFRNTGVKYLCMGINQTRSVLPFDKPTCFWWESPSGARMLAFRADHYLTGNNFGIESKAIKAENMIGHLADLDRRNFPLDRISIQFSGYLTDNSPPSTAACELVKKWNEKYDYPKLRLATSCEFFEYVDQAYGDKLPVYRNAWLDWWSDGCGSSSRETAEVRKTQNMKQVDEGLFSMTSLMGGELGSAIESKIDHISENAIFYDEHTSGAAESVGFPFSENSTRQWLQKGAYSWEALKKVTLLHEEALARFQPFLKKADFPVIYVMNTMGIARSGDIRIFIDYQVMPATTMSKIIDLTTGKEIPAQLLEKRAEGAFWMIEADDVPALGYKAYKIELTENPVPELKTENTETLENRFYKIKIDRNTGAISSIYDKDINKELVDPQSKWMAGQLVRETLSHRDFDYPSFRPAAEKVVVSYSTVSNVIIERGMNGPVWESLNIKSDLDGCQKGMENKPAGIEMEIRLYKNLKKIEFKYMARKEIITDPEALYVSFPVALQGGRIVFETVGGTLSQGSQLPGSSTDWNVAQNFVSVKGKDAQVVVVSNEIPLWHFSDFNIEKYDRIPKAGKPWLYSWVMNNYWFTNFRAFQEGGFSWSYQITSTSDTTNTFATKFAWSERNPFPTRTFPAGANELKTPSLETLKVAGSPNAFLVNTRPIAGSNGTLLLHFRELEGKNGDVNLSTAIQGKTIKKMVEVNALGKPLGGPITSVQLKPYEVKFIEVSF